jgi:putative chitinase
MDDGHNLAAVIAGPPSTSADPQDPLPESNWFYRRLLTFAGIALCALGLAIILAILYRLATLAALSPDTPNATQVQLHTIEALYNLGFWLVIIILVNLTLYMIAPSAEQATKMLATVSALKGGVAFSSRAAVATPSSRAETSSAAGIPAAAPATPLAAEESASAPPAAPDATVAPPAAPQAALAPAAAPEAAPTPAAAASAVAAVESERISAAAAMATLPRPVAMVSVELLRIACPTTAREELAIYVEPIRKACARFEINTIRRVAAFIAQQAHESAGFTKFSESLNYTAARLCQVWPGRFPTVAAAKPYARNPEKLANKVYGGRMGNGAEASGDGWRFRGRGPLQLTGRDNWTRFAKAMEMKLEEALAYGSTPEGGVMAAAWFWETNDINRLADTPSVADETRRINGGTTGLADREKKFGALVARMLKLEKAAA